MRVLWRRLRFRLRAKRDNVSRPEFAPIGKSGRQSGPDLARTELQKTVTGPTQESVPQAARKIGIKKWRAILLRQQETPVGRQDRCQGNGVHARNVSARRGYLQRLGFGSLSRYGRVARDRKSTRLNSSHGYISYAV